MLLNKNFSLVFCTFSFILTLGANSYAGNLSLIEKRLRELDALNKKAISQTTEIPKNGVINATLGIPSGGAVEQLKVKKISVIHFDEHAPFTIQVGSSPQRQRVMEVARKLRANGIAAFVSTPFFHKGKNWWRIFIGSYPTRGSATKANEKLLKNQFPKGFVTNMPYAIQLGAELPEQDAARLEKQLLKKSYLPYLSVGEKQGYFRVLLGAYKTELEAKKAIETLAPGIRLSPSEVLR